MYPSLVGAPLGDSRLSSYWKVIVTIVATVLVLTLQTILYMQTAFGGWESTSASTIQLQSVEHLHVQKVVRTGPKISISSIIASTQREPIDYETYNDDMGQDDMMIYNTNDIDNTADFPLGDPTDSTATNPNLRASSNDENYNSENDVHDNSQTDVGNDENNDQEDDMIYNDTNFPTADPADFPAPKPSANLRASSNDENDNRDTDTNSQSETIHNDDDDTAFPNLLDSVVKAHDAMLQKLRTDYGDQYFDKIFRRDPTLDNTESDDGPKLEMEYLPIRPFAPKDLKFDSYWNEEQKEDYKIRSRAKYFHSASNLKRKMMIRILQAHLPDETSSNTYVWATGGHSAAAGHGNLFHESYTKVMEATAFAVFEASGLTLEARNYAMGGTSSAPEMSMCFAEIYGNDVDIFTWDFGMLEAREYLSGRFLHYAIRGFLSNSRMVPALVGLQQFQNKRVEMMEELHSAWKDDEESNGLALFVNDASYWKTMKANIPDNAGLSDEQINQIPEFLRNFKCDGAIEKGEPYCEDEKYSKEVCPDRMGRAGWHPGWKYNALLGNAMALFVTEVLVDAAREIEKRLHDATTSVSSKELLSELSDIANGHKENMLRKMLEASDSHLPPSYKKVYWYNNTNDDWKFYPEEEKLGLESGSRVFQDRWGELDRRALFFGPSLCHTARLPAQTRFLGHLTNQPDMTGEQTIFGKETYFIGIEDKKYFGQYKLIEEKPEPHQMQLVWTKHKERQEGCGDFLAKPDYHDNFMAVSKERWTILEFPNEAEQEVYGYHRNKENYKGMIIIVPQHCGFGKCEKGYLGATEYNEGKWSMKVNGRNVETMTKIGHEAILLEHDSGIYFDPNENGIYRLEIKVREAESFVKLSSVVLY